MSLDHTFQQVSAAIRTLEELLMKISCAALAAIMFIVIADVTLRYAFSAPLSWGYDVISIYLVTALFFFGLSDTLQHHGHIAVDLLVPKLPKRLYFALQAFGYAMSTLVLGAMSWLCMGRLREAYLNDEVVAAIYPWPTWVAYFLVSAGCATMTLRCLFRTVAHLASAATGRELVEIPPPPITENSTADLARVG